MPDPALNRRGFLLGTASLSAIALGSEDAQAQVIQGGQPWLPKQADVPHPVDSDSYVFFTEAEASFVEAAAERLIPADELGPGAKDCGVALFIDHQLAGAYGRAESWYMRGPWKKGGKTQGFQSRQTPAEMYRAAVKAIDDHVASANAGTLFARLSPSEQDTTLSNLESGALALDGVDGKAFFQMLLMNTKEGMFSDPIYGGNKNMAGWKMIGFPGARYDYRDWVGRHGQKYDLPPVGLTGRPQWTVKD